MDRGVAAHQRGRPAHDYAFSARLWRTVGFDALAQDAAAGVRWLRAQPEVDPRHVGVYGHSQGGTITPLVDARAGGLGFVIASAAGGLDPAEVEIYSVDNSVGLDRLTGADRTDAADYVRELVDVAYNQADRAPLDDMVIKYKDRPWFFAPPPSASSYWAISRQIATFKPAVAWRQVKAPVLLVYGGRDERVPPCASIDAISAALKAGGHPEPTVAFYPEADHVFSDAGGKTNGWPKRQSGYADAMIQWVKRLP